LCLFSIPTLADYSMDSDYRVGAPRGAVPLVSQACANATYPLPNLTARAMLGDWGDGGVGAFRSVFRPVQHLLIVAFINF
jgi:hypothetical protein